MRLKSWAIPVLLVFALPIHGQNRIDKTQWIVSCTIENDGAAPKCDWSRARPDTYLQRLFGPENVPNIALFVVGAAGVIVALSTLKHIEGQTKATEDAAVATQKSATAMLKSVELQEVGLRQWVEIADWENVTRHLQPNVKNATIVIRFKVGNTTKFPITLRTVESKRQGGMIHSHPTR